MNNITIFQVAINPGEEKEIKDLHVWYTGTFTYLKIMSKTEITLVHKREQLTRYLLVLFGNFGIDQC